MDIAPDIIASVSTGFAVIIGSIGTIIKLFKLSKKTDDIDNKQNEILNAQEKRIKESEQKIEQNKKDISKISEQNLIILKKLTSIDKQNENFRDASLIYDYIMKTCNNKLDAMPDFNNELKLALKRGIEEGAMYYKKLYVKGLDNIDKTNELENMINILKKVRIAVSYSNVDLNDIDDFKRILRDALRKYAFKMVNNLEKFKNGNFNGSTLSKYNELAVGSINHIIDTVYYTFSQFSRK